MSKTIHDLRHKLFEALDGLTNPENPMEVKRAQAISNMAHAIIESAKVELQHMKQTGGQGTGFIPEAEPAKLAAPPNGKHRLADLPARTHKLVG